VVLLTLFEGVANTLALQIVNFVDLLLRHKLLALLVRVVDFVAGELGLTLIASTAFINHFFASHACTIVTGLDALVSTARQESFA